VNILVIGLGSVSRCTLPLLFEHVDLPRSAYRVIDFNPIPEHVQWVRDQGVVFEQAQVTQENYAELLSGYVGTGDVIVDLAWNIGTIDILEWCRANGVRYVNASFEVWDPYAGFGSQSPSSRTLYARHLDRIRMLERWGDNAGPTAVLDHGANPGLVSHFVKQALDDITDAWMAQPLPSDPAEAARRELAADAQTRRDWARLAQALQVQVIHISERDTQVSRDPKRENEFVNTWSVEGFYEEGVAPAEMGWGTHERTLPPAAQVHLTGPLNQICMAHPGFRTQVRSWVPCGEIVGMVIRHGEAYSISDVLTVTEHGLPVYRPTVHYAYCPTDAAVASLHELHMRNYELQPEWRIMNDDIVDGRDELGCLLMGHPFESWWIGSLLDIHEARSLVPNQNATTLQVAAGMLGAILWLLDHPDEGVCLPDDLPHEAVLKVARPYLGPFVSQAADWTPLDNWVDPFAGYGRPKPAPEDVWQFTTFLVQGP
jgi:homospermidine synthase